MSGKRRPPGRVRDDRPAADLTPEELAARRQRNASRMREAAARPRERIERAEAVRLPPDFLPDDNEDDVALREAGDRARPGPAVSVEVALAMLAAFGETRH